MIKVTLSRDGMIELEKSIMSNNIRNLSYELLKEMLEDSYEPDLLSVEISTTWVDFDTHPYQPVQGHILTARAPSIESICNTVLDQLTSPDFPNERNVALKYTTKWGGSEG